MIHRKRPTSTKAYIQASALTVTPCADVTDFLRSTLVWISFENQDLNIRITIFDCGVHPRWLDEQKAPSKFAKVEACSFV